MLIFGREKLRFHSSCDMTCTFSKPHILNFVIINMHS